MLAQVLDRVAAVLEDPGVAVDVGDLAAARRGVRVRRVVGHEAEVVLVDLHLAEVHRLDGAVGDRDLVRLAGAVVGDREACPAARPPLRHHRPVIRSALRPSRSPQLVLPSILTYFFFQPPPSLLAIFPAPLRTSNSREAALLGRRQLLGLGGGDRQRHRALGRALHLGRVDEPVVAAGRPHDDAVEDVLPVVVERPARRCRARPRRSCRPACRARRPCSGPRARRRSSAALLRCSGGLFGAAAVLFLLVGGGDDRGADRADHEQHGDRADDLLGAARGSLPS